MFTMFFFSQLVFRDPHFRRYWTNSHRKCTTFVFINGGNLFPVAIAIIMFSISLNELQKNHIILLTIMLS